MSVIININHETSHTLTDASNYDSVEQDGSDLSIVDGGLAGTGHKLSVFVNAQASLVGIKNISAPASGILRARLYINTNGFGDSGGAYVAMQIFNTTMVQHVAAVYIRNHAAVPYIWCARFRNDAGAVVYQPEITSVSDGEHYIELLVTRATTDVSANGTCQAWLDGVSMQAAVTNIDNYDLFGGVNQFRVGADGINATMAGTIFADEIVVNDDGGVIGPYEAGGGGVTTITATTTATVTDDCI